MSAMANGFFASRFELLGAEDHSVLVVDCRAHVRHRSFTAASSSAVLEESLQFIIIYVLLTFREHIIYVRYEIFTTVTMKNAVFRDIKSQFVPHRRHITSPLQCPVGLMLYKI
jgi:hypothetical protein